MSPRLGFLFHALWVAHPAFEVAIVALMVRRGLHRKFKFFFGYLITQLISFAAVFGAYAYKYDGSLTFYLYWVCTAINVGFGFGVIHEVFVDVFRAFHTLRDLGTVLFKWAGLVMLLVGGVVSVSTGSSELPPWLQAIVTTQRCTRFIQVGMVLFLLFFAHYLGVSRRQQSFGIALGFGSFAVVELILMASWVGNHLGNPWMSMVNMAAYNLSLGIWLGYIVVKSPARDASTMLLRPQRWEQSLSDIQNPLPSDSLIPMFEGMVDRALSRKQPETPVVRQTRSNDTPWNASTPSELNLPPERVTSKS
jgi:hypothetical protein